MIYFVRHGETDFNLKHIVQGQLDVPLNETGLSQAREIAEKLKDIHLDLIYCSPLSRAKATAEEINKFHNIDIIFDKRLMEFYSGRRQGRAHSDFTEEERQIFKTNPEYFGGESHQDFFDRVAEFYKTIENSEKDILIVSHGGTYRNLYRYLHNLECNAEAPHVQNCEIIKLK